MSKAYSNKALPPGTVLREWRLEEVLGVGGFGIVYKGRGIYFDELVAIKEYFPSSISERDAEDTVVPIDSDAEEVHALGLKKFVEEAKLLWNLSTPTRHPNIVSVRSLFEVHGTAYMVMDFEDGVSLSKMLKQGRRFNERSLWSLIQPIAEGLERAHRVGVLHRDIKPPNILVTPDNRPVLIDFGSARFEAAEATSTKVTFHTPPYAAIEQYVKTYEQGPWTDIYALGVVLYECVTGQKPPEVLERMHGGLGTRLADGKWPGYGDKFLAAVDAAMTIKPAERPQSISAWLAMFDEMGKAETVAGDEDEATRFFAHEVAGESIVPVPPPAPGFTEGERIETQIPDDPSEVEFKRVGHDTHTAKKKTAAAAAAAAAMAADEEEVPAEPAPADEAKAGKKKPAKAGAAAAPEKKRLSPALAAGGAVALLVAAAGGWALFGSGSNDGADDSLALAPDSSAAASQALDVSDASNLPPAMTALANEARTVGIPDSAIGILTGANDELGRRLQSLQALTDSPADASAATRQSDEMKQLAAKANLDFANALLRDADSRSNRLASDVPWANPARASAARRESSDRQAAAARIRNALSTLRATVQGAAEVADPTQAFALARQALAQTQTFNTASAAAYRLGAETRTAVAAAPSPTVAPAATKQAAPVKAAPAAAAAASSATSLSPAKSRQFESIISEGRDMARQVIRMGGRGSDAGAQQRRANVALARNYDSHLVGLKDSFRGVNSDREADALIQQARQTRNYLQFLVKQSSGTL